MSFSANELHTLHREQCRVCKDGTEDDCPRRYETATAAQEPDGHRETKQKQLLYLNTQHHHGRRRSDGCKFTRMLSSGMLLDLTDCRCTNHYFVFEKEILPRLSPGVLRAYK